MQRPEFPRHFVSPSEPLCDWAGIEPYFVKLQQSDLDTPERINAWLLDWSELAAGIDEVARRLYVRMTCQTDDEQRKQAYLDFVEHVEPKCKPMWHAVDRKYVSSAASNTPTSHRFTVFDRSARNRVELFRDENVMLEVEEAKLEQEFQEVTAAMSVHYDGKDQTLQQLAVYLERTDRKVRQEVWELIANRRMDDADRLEDIFDELFQLRHRMARNADLPDFRAYAFKGRERFDYTPDDCMAFHDAVEKTCVPLMRGMQDERKKSLGVDPLRPWDSAVDIKGRPPLKPFDTPEELIEKCTVLFDRIDPELGAQFREMVSREDLDVGSRKGKAPGGYQSTFCEVRRPFIFMNAVGLQRDVRTLIHEGGHAFHTLACRDEPLVQYRSAPIEFAEVASMGMEMLAYDHLDVFHTGDELARAKRDQIEGIITILPWIATIDAFQHWMYTHPDHTREQRRDHWLSLRERFGGTEDYSEYETVLARQWQRQLHLFEVPFYYIEYGIAQLGALQVWLNAKRNHVQALDDYRTALALGGSRPLPELFEAAGIKWDFSVDTLEPLMAALQNELNALDD